MVMMLADCQLAYKPAVLDGKARVMKKERGVGHPGTSLLWVPVRDEEADGGESHLTGSNRKIDIYSARPPFLFHSRPFSLISGAFWLLPYSSLLAGFRIVAFKA
jgi:hypothetical protein